MGNNVDLPSSTSRDARRVAWVSGLALLFVAIAVIGLSVNSSGEKPISKGLPPTQENQVAYSADRPLVPAAVESNPLAEPTHDEKKPIAEVREKVLWERFPSGLSSAAENSIQRNDGKGAFELAALILACEGMEGALENSRQHFADMQARGDLKVKDKHLADDYLSWKRRDLAVCQTLSGDLVALRRRLLEVAVREGVDGSGMKLFLLGNKEPFVMRQVLKEAETGHASALGTIAFGQDSSGATRLQVEAARDAIVRAARDAELRADPRNRLDGDLASVERQVALEAWALDQNNPTKRAIAKAAYQGNGAPKVEPSTDPQVTALSSQYLEALKKRRRAEAPQP